MFPLFSLLNELEIESDLHVEHADGDLYLIGKGPEGVHLKFSNEQVFRHFLQSLRASGIGLRDAVRRIDEARSLNKPFSLTVGEETLIRHRPGAKLYLSYSRLFQQFVLLLMKR